ncbi:MAG TPA: aminotransferase class I/II-fold pyridoxal phosphate-dependent enzyme [Thermoanaerobaculia bacterium]|nr:aminotransferase class I/II-fold pyridoxal phosphate-dependent enzyme [Thermoanaerobaculia bacterium]
MDPRTAINSLLQDGAPELFRALSPLGQRAFFPPDVPAQSAEARGKELNGTIGQITDGRGGAVPLPSLATAFAGLSSEDLSRALLYSPIEGIPEVRQRWREWQRRGLPGSSAEGNTEIPSSLPPSSLPIVTAGLTHSLSVLADLFASEGRVVAVPRPFWGNYRQTFAVRTGAEVRSAPAYIQGDAGARYNTRVFAEALDGLPEGEPAVVLLNLPSNPGGYSLTAEERREVLDSLRDLAERRPLVVICDDAYAGLVFEPDIPSGSLFWDLAGAHPNLIPVKVDGGTKEFSFFGGRVGFVTFACEPDSEVARALESKVKMLVRSVIGSPVALSQVALLQALRNPGVEGEIQTIRELLAERYRALKQALAGVDPELLTVLPFNSGCFALVELPETLGLTAEQVRRHLLEHYDTGLIAMEPRYLRIAHCSVDAAALPELVSRLETGVRELAGR